ncbi:MAG: alpha-ketoglutarate-dependent dioxygenase AlkB [Anaerolineae bacterium]|nr:alpha-ketoglutarate-dependent dioxygenase AlkB [Anaerolineae bacterium]
MPDAEVLFYPGFFSAAESQQLFETLAREIHWAEQSITIYGKSVKVPRLVAWYGDAGKSYTYSGTTMHPEPWIPALLTMKARIEAVAGVTFNTVLLNYYRNEQDSMGWHSDDEPELGKNPVIASVSLGATRSFQFKHKRDSELRQSINLTSGSLLLMRGPTQHFWKHQIPKTKRPLDPRINLTFRVVKM